MRSSNSFFLRIFCASLFIVTGFAELQASSCFPQGYLFNTQSKIDNFAITYPNCDSIEGDVSIGGNITNLHGLSSIVYIKGDLSINGCLGLQNLTGLTNLQGIGGLFSITSNPQLIHFQDLGPIDSLNSVFISNNSRLESLSGLDSVQYIEFGILLRKNPSLKSLIGLGSLTYGGLSLEYNDSLSSLHGLDQMRKIEGHLNIVGNNSLLDLGGLDSIKSVSGYLSFGSNDRLKDISALSQIESVGALQIADNDSLLNLMGLGKLEIVMGELNIYDSPNLESISGLYGLTEIGSDLEIVRNNKLTDLLGLGSLVRIGGYLMLHDLDSLQNLNGLSALDSLGHGGFAEPYSLIITDNDSLSDILALSSVDFLSKGVKITNNPVLGDCAVDIICRLLPDPINYKWDISANAFGCENRSTLSAACSGTLSLDVPTQKSLSVYPNPAQDFIRFDWAFSEGEATQNISVFNIHGELITQQKLLGLKGSWLWDTFTLPNGVYFYRFDNAALKGGKFVVLHQ